MSHFNRNYLMRVLPCLLAGILALLFTFVFGVHNHAGDFCQRPGYQDPTSCPLDYSALLLNLFSPLFFWTTIVLYILCLLILFIKRLLHIRKRQ